MYLQKADDTLTNDYNLTTIQFLNPVIRHFILQKQIN